MRESFHLPRDIYGVDDETFARNLMNNSLRERLERLGVTRGVANLKSAAGPVPSTPPSPPASGGEQSEASVSPPLAGGSGGVRPGSRTGRPRIGDVVQGTYVETAEGVCFVTEQHWPAGSAHGGFILSRLAPEANGAVPHLVRDSNLADFDFHQAVFLDVETTSLVGGTGTYAFLVGVGQFEPDGGFRIRQFFMRDLHEERALLTAVSEAVRNQPATVTFNGKAFDLPLLSTRYALARRRSPFEGSIHLDLLHPARRLWSARLPSCALVALEEFILGVVRHEDIPGWEIPGVYARYVYQNELSRLPQVFAHNAQDVVSMAALAGRMCCMFHDPEVTGITHGVDWFSLGRLYEDLGWLERSMAAYQRALATQLPPAIWDATLFYLSFLHKRREAWEKALALWQDLVELRPPRGLYPFVELAKYYEHRRGDYETALRLVQEAIQLVESFQIVPRRQPRSVALAELKHREARLERRLRGGISPAPTDVGG